MDAEELEERIAAFPRWLYRFEFEDGVVTPVAQPGQINRQEQRRRYFFDALLELTGGTLAGRRVLDLGCNAGLWSLLSIEAGAEYVLGIDVHAPYIEQAQLVFEQSRVDTSRYRFEVADIFERDFNERFDVVLCLGVLEVSARPVELFEIFRAVEAPLVVIDTAISTARSSTLEIGRMDDPHDRTRTRLTLIPTPRAVAALADEQGLQTAMLAYDITQFAGMEDYRRGQRRAFMAARDGSALAALGARAVSGQSWRAQGGEAGRLRQALDARGLQMVRERLRRG